MKKLIKKLSFSLFSVLALICAIFSTGISAAKTTFAASPIDILSKEGEKQSEELVISEILNGTKTIYLYSNGNGSSAKNLFSYYYGSDAVKGNDSNETTLLHNVGSGLVSKTVEGNGQFVSTIGLSNNIIVALQNGFVTNLSSSATVSSKQKTSFGDADEPEQITMALYIFDSSAETFDATNSSNGSAVVNQKEYNGYTSSKNGAEFSKALSTSLSGFNGKSFNSIALSFRSKFTPAYSTPLGIASTTGKNYMKVEKPTLSISTSDRTVPTISAVANKTAWSKDNSIVITAADAQSGIQKIEVSKDGSAWTLVSGTGYAENLEYKTTAETTYAVSENGTYKFRVTDNVGNTAESTVVISNVDATETTASLSLADFYTSNTFGVDIAVTSAGGSPNYLYYTYEKDGVVSEQIPYTNGANNITLADGTYNMTFYAYDEATLNDGGNAVKVYEKTIIVDTTNYSVNISYQNSTGTESFNTLRALGKNMTFAPANANSHFYKLIVTDAITNDIVEVLSEISETSYTFDVTRHLNIEVLYRQQVELVFESEYEYNVTDFELEIKSANISGDYEIVYSFADANGSNIAQINGVGTYKVSYTIDDDRFFGNGTQENIVISPKAVSITNVQTEYEYNANGNILVFESDIDLEFVIVFSGTSSEFKSVGEYSYVIALADTAFNKNYSVSASGTAEIVPCVVEISQTNSAEFVYDKTEKTYDFVTNVDDETLVIVVTYNGLTEKPVNAGNYSVVLSTENTNYVVNHTGLLKISKRAVTVTMGSKNLTYGDALGNLEYSVSNALESEELVFDAQSNFENKFGTYSVWAKQENTLSEAEEILFANYEITYVRGEIKVAKKSLVIYPTEKQTKEYGDVDPTIAISSLTGLVAGDEVTVELSRQQGEVVGYYNITINSFVGENYEPILVPTQFRIVKRVAFISIEWKTKVYGDVDPAFSLIFANSNILEKDYELFESKLSRQAGEDVGVYTISFDKKEIENYSIISFDGSFEITKRTANVVANATTSEYGSTADLTFSVSNLAFEDVLLGSLSRQAGENVGEYEILIGTLSHKNYNINFTSAIYEITPKAITVTATNTEKVYGEADELECTVNGALEDLNIVLSREIGEDVGTYEINGFVLENPNYAVTFEKGTLTITKAEVLVVVEDASKTYGETDPTFTANVTGLKFNDEIVLEFSRNSGENAGEYEISVSNAETFKNYTLSVTNGTLSVEKKDISLTLADKEVTYNGKAWFIDELESEFELQYFYTYYGKEIEEPVNAGKYNAYVVFAGDENHNEFISKPAILEIGKKFIPITIKNAVFAYNGSPKSPSYEINLEEEVNIQIKYENDIVPIEPGEYKFTVESNDPNYYSNFASVLKIVNEFYSEDESGSASVSTGNVNFSNSGIQIYEDKNSSLMSMFTPLKNDRTTLSVYGFRNISDAVADEDGVFTVRIYAPHANKDVKIYTVDENGKAVAVSYTYADGAYILSLNTLNTKIVLTEADMTAYYAKIALTIIAIIGCVIGTAISRKRKKSNFIRNNTKFVRTSAEYAEKHRSIVVSKINFEKYMTNDEIINAKK